MGARSRLLSTAALAALTLPFVPGIAWASNAVPPSPPAYTSRACPPGATPDAGFADTKSDAFRGEINCIAAYDITHGRTTTSYDPGGIVSRREMARFLSNLLADTTKGRPAGHAPCQFVDIGTLPADEQDIICGLAAAQITSGKSDPQHFDPATPVTRGEMAVFLVRSLKYAGLDIATPQNADYFDDDNGSFAEVDINKLASVGVVQGKVQSGKRYYDVGEPLARDEMAAYLARTLELAIEQSVASTKFPGGTGYTVSPATPQQDQKGTTVSFTASGMPSSSPIVVALFACGNVDTSGSSPKFVGSGTASQGAVQGIIASVDVTDTNSSKVSLETGSSGGFSFTVQDQAAECVVPVVFNNADGDRALDIDSNGQPLEVLGIGGRITFYTRAPAGAVASGTVSNPTDSTFEQGGNGTYTYDSGDTYQLYDSASSACTSSTYADFKSRLTAGDSVTGTFAPSGTSVYCLQDVAPLPPSSVTAASDSTHGGVAVTWNDSGTASVTGYAVYRATATAPQLPPPLGSYTCPSYGAAAGQSPQSPPTSGWTQVGTVADKGSGNHAFSDTTADASGSDHYCYLVVSIDARGQQGTARAASQNSSGGVVAAPKPANPGAPAFASLKQVDQDTFTAVYNQAIDTSTCAADGSDFSVSYTTAGSAQTAAVQSAACDDKGASGAGQATLTLAANVPSGASVNVTARVGSDGNTVCAAGDASNCQAAGNTVSGTASSVAPAFAAASISGDTTRITLTYNEFVDPATISTSDYKVVFKDTQKELFVNSVDTGGSNPTRTVVLVTQVGGDNTVTVSLATGGSVCDPANATNCQQPGDSIDATAPHLVPQMTGVTCATASGGGVDCVVTYNEGVSCHAGAGVQFTLNGTAGVSCNFNETGDTSTERGDRILVHFTGTVPSSLSLSYQAPASPTVDNAVFHPSTGGGTTYASSQTISG